jgi:small subunit ribosomal protein S9
VAKKDKNIMTTGKRKTSIARVTAKVGTGLLRINSKSIDVYEPEVARIRIKESVILASEVAQKMNISVNVFGGGYLSQADAARVAIAKAIVEFSKSKEIRKKFLDYDRNILVSDTRRTEPQKPYRSSARSKRQKSKR